jgi:D-xylose 1-dehydrogenase (NADP+, D-xylono-1,5-lactone-forming)
MKVEDACMTATFKWGLLSTARICGAIVGAMPQSERGEVAAVASRDLERAQAYARQHNIPRAYGSYDELLADPDVHIIYNPLPNHLHAEWTIRALQAGKHVLCEKPFALSLEEVDAMFAAAEQSGRVLAEAFMYRHHPKVLKTRELIDSGAIGQPRYLHASYTSTLGRPGDTRWNPEMGGGALWDIGCYPVSLIRYLFGAPARVEGWQRLTPSGVDGTFVASLYYDDSRAAQFDCSLVLPFRCWAEIVGDEGVIRFERPFQPDSPDARLALRRGDHEDVIELANPGRFWLEIEDMHDAIITGQAPLISPAETRGTVETILALFESARAR